MTTQDDALRPERAPDVGEFGYESFNRELETVIGRHNEIWNATPGFCVAIMLHEADYRRAVHGVDLDVESIADDVWLVNLGPSAATLGVGNNPEKLADLDVDLAVADYRTSRTGGGPHG